jgi:hypothetical protein
VETIAQIYKRTPRSTKRELKLMKKLTNPRKTNQEMEYQSDPW